MSDHGQLDDTVDDNEKKEEEEPAVMETTRARKAFTTAFDLDLPGLRDLVEIVLRPFLLSYPDPARRNYGVLAEMLENYIRLPRTLTEATGLRVNSLIELHRMEKWALIEYLISDAIRMASDSEKATLFDNENIVSVCAMCSAAVYRETPQMFLDAYEKLLNRSKDERRLKIIQHSTANIDECPYIIVKDSLYNLVYVAFRGTNSISDILADVSSNPASLDVGHVHHGFHFRAEQFIVSTSSQLKAAIGWTSAVGEHADIIFCGHSLGGAVAQLVAIKLTLSGHYRKSIKSVTFGSPLVCDDTLARRLDQRGLTPNFLNIVYRNDLVPRALLLPSRINRIIVRAGKTLSLWDGSERQFGENELDKFMKPVRN
jgi:hypothetical protein